MHEYDTVLKALLQSPQSTVIERITGARIERWLNVEFPEVQQTRVDLLGSTQDPERLVAVELQSTNESKIPIRLAEYALRAYRLHGVFPDQYLLYVGEAEMRMPSEIISPKFNFRFTLIDIRELDEETLLNSPFDSDSIVAILTRPRDRRETIRRILARIAKLESGRRDEALRKLLILSGLRHLGDAVRAEVKYMPILDDIMDHDLLGPILRQGRQEGRQEGELAILRRLLNKRFGPLPAGIDERLSQFSAPQLEDLSVRILDAKNIDELFQS